MADIETPPSGQAFARGYSDVVNCNGPWVRGKAKLLSDGTLVIFMGLETDSTTGGSAGWIEFQLKDNNGNTVAHGNTDTRSIPPKDPGNARIVDIQPFEKPIPADVAAKVRSISVSAHCAQAPFGLWDIHLSPSDIATGIKLILGSP